MRKPSALRVRFIIFTPAIVLFLLLCTGMLLHGFPARRDFQQFAMDVFCHEISSSTLNLHYTLADPSAFGIEEEHASFGNITASNEQNQHAWLVDCREQLDRFLNSRLDENDRLTAEILDWWIDSQLVSEQFYYYQEPLGSTIGIQAQLPVLLAEFPFRNAEDIDIYLELLGELPDYFEQLLNYEQEKSRCGLFMNDELLDQVLDQCRSLLPVLDSHFLVTTFRERLAACDFLSSDQKIAWEVRNLDALLKSFVPAYEQLVSGLENLRGTGSNTKGLYHMPEGLDYYESLLQYTIGTDLSIPKIHQLLEEQMESDYEIIYESLQAGADLAGLTGNASETPAEILNNLQKQIEQDFPAPASVSWQIKQVPDSLAEHLSPAFYMTPAIDAEEQNTIYINPSYEPDRTELITTLAHEGYPGHLYQSSFENRDSFHPVRNLPYIGGYTEGWGLYSEFYAYDYLGLAEEEADLLRALSSLNYAVCASLDLSIHGEGWSEEDCIQYLSAFGITDREQIHSLYLNILEEPANYLKYYLGYLEICRLKESALALSSNLTIYDFHKWFLETGPAPFPVLQKHLDFLKVSLKLLHSADQNLQFIALKPVHDRLDHLFVECRMLPVGGNSLVCQGQQHHPLILRTADAGYISLFHQIVDGGG